jgi:putative SOS response-associated peptidase YedK
MCGRYTLAAPNPAALRLRFGLSEQVVIRPRYNVAPGDDVLAITTDKAGAPRAEELRWGLVPPWVLTPGAAAKMINARAETVTEKPAYRSAFERFRCLVLADGFYEWGNPDGGPRRAFHVTRADHQPFAFAGLWSVWHRGGSDELRSCTIITTAPNHVVARLHDRMPAILDGEAESAWLAADTPAPALLELLHGLPAAQTVMRPVGPAVNDARYDGPECLAEPDPTLF